jgi:hypothetical protein
VNKQIISSDMSAEQATERLRVAPSPIKIAVRNMDNFVHLIKLRDGIETPADLKILN